MVAAFAQLGDLQERSDRQQALATKAVEVDKCLGPRVSILHPQAVHNGSADSFGQTKRTRIHLGTLNFGSSSPTSLQSHEMCCCCSQAVVYDRSYKYDSQCLHTGRFPKPLLPLLHAEGSYADHSTFGEVLSEKAAFPSASWLNLGRLDYFKEMPDDGMPRIVGVGGHCF